jgi:hypothetical protein
MQEDLVSQAVAPISLVRSSGDARVQPRSRTAYAVLSAIFAGGLIVQVFGAGLGVFVGDFTLHRVVPLILGVVLLGMLVTARPALLPKPMARDTVLLLGVFIVQGLLADVRGIMPAVSAFHPVNALLLVALAFSIARRAIAAAKG